MAKIVSMRRRRTSPLVGRLAVLTTGRPETNSRQLTPKHQGKPAIIRDQRTRPVNNIHNLTKSAKPPSPVQIRAAPPNSQFKSDCLFFPRTIQRL